jgi:hypothetical protein
MKILVSKIGAARSQLLEAIRLFFEQRDAVSIHTLVCASMQILHDHIDEGVAWDNNLLFHYDSIYIDDEFRKEWKNHINDPANFFKHADNDLKKGRDEIEFNSTMTSFFILESIRCLKILEEESFVFSPEFRIFFIWYALRYPRHVKIEARERFENLKHLSVDDYKGFRDVISLMTKHPQFVDQLVLHR